MCINRSSSVEQLTIFRLWPEISLAQLWERCIQNVVVSIHPKCETTTFIDSDPALVFLGRCVGSCAPLPALVCSLADTVFECCVVEFYCYTVRLGFASEKIFWILWNSLSAESKQATSLYSFKETI